MSRQKKMKDAEMMIDTPLTVGKYAQLLRMKIKEMQQDLKKVNELLQALGSIGKNNKHKKHLLRLSSNLPECIEELQKDLAKCEGSLPDMAIDECFEILESKQNT